jgi:hypothetical protein
MDDYRGFHNSDLDKSIQRLESAQTYQDLSTICVIPALKTMPSKVTQSWMSLMTPMNQKFIRLFIYDMEVGDAYNAAVEFIMGNPELSKWKYMLTLETDNMPPPDGVLKLYEDMKEFDVVGGLYWTKGEGGQPMIYGDPHAIPLNFIPQKPKVNTVQPCMGLGMGFDLFKLSIFKDKRLTQPFFKTLQEFNLQNGGARSYTQDLYFFEKIHALGYKVACDTRVRVGHFDLERDMVW